MATEHNLSKAFDFLFCGLVFACFGMPFTAIGFVIAGFGCRGLASESTILEQSQYLCFSLALCSTLFAVSTQEQTPIVAIPLSAIGVLLVWRLLGGVAEVATKHDYAWLAGSARWRRSALVITFLLALIVAGLTKIGAAIPLAVALAAMVPVALMGLSVLHLLYVARWQFSAPSQRPAATTPPM